MKYSSDQNVIRTVVHSQDKADKLSICITIIQKPTILFQTEFDRLVN